MSGAALATLLVLTQTPPQGALGTLADGIVAQVRAARVEPPVAVAVSAPGRPALEQAFATVLVSRLADAGLGPRLLPAGRDPEAVARERGARTLIRLRLSLDAALTASGDVLSTWVNFWAGRTPTRSASPAAALAAEASPDATVRLLARAETGVTLLLEPEPLARWPVRTEALAAGDLDGDGRAELAILIEGAVEVRARDGRLLARRTLEALPRAERATRDPFGTLCICERRLLAFGADRARGEVLELVGDALVARGTLERPVVGCAQERLEATFPPGQARLLPAGGPWPPLSGGPRAWGASVRPTRSGPAVLVQLEDGTARWSSGPGRLLALPAVGSGAAAVDLAADGVVRIAASSSAAAPAVDRLRLLAAADGAERSSLEVPGRIVQVAAADVDGDGRESLLLGIWRPEGGSELRLVRGQR